MHQNQNKLAEVTQGQREKKNNSQKEKKKFQKERKRDKKTTYELSGSVPYLTFCSKGRGKLQVC